jgi:hypothetical protein
MDETDAVEKEEDIINERLVVGFFAVDRGGE